MTGTRVPLKIVTSNRTSPAPGRTVSPLSAGASDSPKPKLLDQLRESLRSRHYSRRTEQTYCQWVKRFIFFHLQDIDFSRSEITIRDGKGAKDRITMLPE